MTIDNKVLLRQLKKAKLSDYATLQHIELVQFEKFLQMVEETYENMDSNVYRLERALEISTSELRTFNDSLEEKIRVEVEKNRQKDQKLLSQSRYAGMGEMIGNIAHQWRQPLSAISTTATGVQLQMELGIIEDEEIKTSLNKIVEFTNFLTQTIEDFRGYLKEDKEQQEFDIIEIFQRSKNIVESTYYNHNIQIIYQPTQLKKKSFGFSNELSQVFLNILNNAKDALLEKNTPNKKVFIEFSEDGQYNTIKITDNAGGIPEKIIDKIFDPYFTTKHQSQGTGIGLYMSKDIVEKNMFGSISAENVTIYTDTLPFKGACFTISIPTFDYFKSLEKEASLAAK
ncbi:MAG: HAMP domain-containing histidine kinase [Campylobacterales bacterium]|nr:HAMP domain-containing histidine kinase [Campylobacterales bacterium]